MSTTRHLINRQRRLAAASAAAGERTVRPSRDGTGTSTAASTGTSTGTVDRARAATAVKAARPRRPVAVPRQAAAGRERVPLPASAERRAGRSTARRTSSLRLPARFPLTIAVLALLTVLLGGFAAWAAGKASALHGDSATANTALTDNARTAEVKGQIAQDVNSVFSYDYTDTARTDTAAKRVLTGKAVQQYATMIAQVKAAAPKQKLVLTTTVTDTGVEMIDGDRARVLVYADQGNTSTAKGANAGSAYSAAMFAVDAVRQAGTWKIASIDTFG